MPPRNPWICIVIICLLGAVALGGLAGMIVLPLYSKPVGEALIAITSGAAGSLGTFLTQVPRGSVGAAGGQQP